MLCFLNDFNNVIILYICLKNHWNDQAMMSLWTIFGDSLIKSYLMIYGLPRTYNISNVALHTKVQLNAFIHG